MIRGLFTLGFLLFLAAAGIWVYRNHWDSIPDLRQADAGPSVSAQPKDASAPPVAGQPPFVQEAPPLSGTPPVPPVPAPPVLPAQPVAPRTADVPNPPTPRVGRKTHVVESGETLWAISQHYFGTPSFVEAIADANHLDRPNMLRPGMVLVLPEIPGLTTTPEPRPVDVAPRSEPNQQVTETPQRQAPMPPTLSRTVPVQP